MAATFVSSDGISVTPRAAAERLSVPYVAVDVGQAEGGEWVVIETGDPQFAGVSQISLFRLWGELRKPGMERPHAS